MLRCANFEQLFTMLCTDPFLVLSVFPPFTLISICRMWRSDFFSIIQPTDNPKKPSYDETHEKINVTNHSKVNHRCRSTVFKGRMCSAPYSIQEKGKNASVVYGSGFWVTNNCTLLNVHMWELEDKVLLFSYRNRTNLPNYLVEEKDGGQVNWHQTLHVWSRTGIWASSHK